MLTCLVLCCTVLWCAVLCSCRFIKRDHIVRPHIAELLRLYPHFRIGVFSSATIRTVNTALDTLYAALQRSTSHTGIGEQPKSFTRAERSVWKTWASG
jgi:hypothetical protein